ncbi:uncharacterized protein F5147DRAFT_17765 [Suillus discolor]|uniref:Uncharacterized protein n=1 Tax=Suillus discolor TaxID=1912936 RepID=A0A9P7FEM5_9AGAM|nr:uncharacterized protein F5147DRAFT_17765 [Suillus discolor]KAG2114159.1 hypothetical protein F5147DRAFT_17765 [Suillus discolor]
MDYKFALWLVPSGPEAEALRYFMEFRPRPDKPRNDKPKNVKSKDVKPKDDKPKRDKSDDGKSKDGKSKGGKSDDGKSKDGKSKDGKSKHGKSDDGKSKDGKSKDGKSKGGKSEDGKSKDGKSKDGKSEDGKSRSDKSSTHSISSRSTSSYLRPSYPRPSYDRPPHFRSSHYGPPHFGPPHYGPPHYGQSHFGPSHFGSGPSYFESGPSYFGSPHFAQPHFGTPYLRSPQLPHSRSRSRSYPRFDAHITLATFSCPYRPNTFQLVPMGAKTTPVHFESMEVGDDYLSSLSIVAQKSSELMQLRDRIMDHLKANNIRILPNPSFPRVSLFYLDESFKGERLLLSKQLRETGRVHEIKGGEKKMSLNCSVDGAGPEFDAMQGFEGMEIWLVDCTEGVEDWSVLDRRYLKPRMPKAKVYVKRGDPYMNIFGSEGPDPYQVREMASYIPRWGEPGNSGIYGPMAPYYPLDPRYYTHNHAQWEDPRMRGNMYPSQNRWGYGSNMNAYRELEGYF